MLAERQVRRAAGYFDWQIFAILDRKLSLAAADRARRSRSNLLLYNPYAWEAFTSRYVHAPRRVLFQFHPHPDFERRILLNDSARYRFFNYSYEDEMGSRVDDGVKQRTRDCWRHADLILCASEFTRRSLIEAGADPAKCHIVYYGIDLPQADDALAPASFHVSFVGSGTQRKGLHHLILAWQKAALSKGSRLTVVCRWIDPGLEQLVLKSPGVQLVRGLSGVELRRLFASSALLAMPSLVEGFGQIYLEALAEGCPVLGTPNTCLPDIGPSPAISIVEPGAIDQLIAKLEVLSSVLPGNREIRTHARACAARWPWIRFRESLCQALTLRTASKYGNMASSISSRAPYGLAQ
jgi:glycosyltransferase involved in cell wall biosynthesis